MALDPALTPRQIEIIRAVMIAGSIAGAARLLNVAQPGASRAMKHLESKLGIMLFIRQGERYVPAPGAGDVFTQLQDVHKSLENRDDTLRITLNGAESQRTLAGRFIAERFGSAVQHIAFLTEDILKTSVALERNGFRPLDISDNYFDDLEARFGLAPVLADRLRERNILYDRHEQGEFFQLYSPTYGDGFFFEIVERRNGYQGYGAANAQCRLAAQQRALRRAKAGMIQALSS